MEPKKKGILKNKSTLPASEKLEGPQQLKWDEETIATQEKERGGKMKITEPKTPYNYYESDEEEENVEMIGQVISKLEEHQMEMDENSPQVQRMEQDLDEEDQKEEFKKKQKMHYKNEYLKAKMLMKKYSPKEEEEETQ